MFRVLFLMIALLAGLIAGPYLSGQQGYVRVETANTVYEMSLTTLVILFVVTLAVIYSLEWLVTRFFRLSNNTYNWFSRRKRVKAQRQTLEGLMKMNEGDYAKAEKLIGKNAKHSAEPVLNLIKAAEAAQQRGDEFSANRYLIEATELAGSDNLVVEIARTRILLQQNKLPENLIQQAQTAFDVVAIPAETPFIQHAQKQGKQTISGAEVIVLQAVEQFELYTGIRPNDQLVAEAAAFARKNS